LSALASFFLLFQPHCVLRELHEESPHSLDRGAGLRTDSPLDHRPVDRVEGVVWGQALVLVR